MIHTALDQSISLVSHYGLLGVLLSMVIENCGIPFPTEGAFLVAQHLISQGRHSFWLMYWFIVISHVIGAVIAYWLGYFLGDVLKKIFAKSQGFQEANQKIHDWYKKYGSVTVLATRLIGYVRPWSSLIAGWAQYPFWPFLFWSAIGSILFVYPTMKLTGILVLIWDRYPGYHYLISVLMLLSFFVLILYGLIRKYLWKSKKQVSQVS